MFLEIKKKIDRELQNYIRSADKLYCLRRISPVLFEHIKEFICREGKRIRPTLFVIGYQGYCSRPAPGLWRSAVSLELLHDFMLVHDDIIDKSPTRRGQPSMHALLNRCLRNHKNLKFNGQDLTIVVGDVMYAMALDAFLAVKENPLYKERALRTLIEAALYTGSGEFIELLYGLKSLKEFTRQDIYKIYDLKTANYTFAAPLTIGAALAGVGKKELRRLYSYGMYLGRAFQIKDDIIGLMNEEKDIGKSNLTDLQEAKKTILVWHAFHHSSRKEQSRITHILSKDSVTYADLNTMRRIVEKSGALRFAKRQIQSLRKNAQRLNHTLSMRTSYKEALDSFGMRLLSV
ncbi:MAG: polyprenyl synthetase family protein [Candidatus Omnitrophica bacterium]|nr:polyprenyl synthetase family protein [Candidatus Omnitrophota bacterium]